MAYKDWYEENKETLNRRRRKRYRKDKTYREKQLANTRRWRKNRAKLKAVEPEKPRTEFTIGEVAKQINCEQKTIRTLEKAGLIPSTSDGIRHRRYSKKQIKLVRDMVEFRKRVHYKDPRYEPGLKVRQQRAFAQWS